VIVIDKISSDYNLETLNGYSKNENSKFCQFIIEYFDNIIEGIEIDVLIERND